MFGKTKKPKQTARIDSLIGQHTEIRGDVVFNGGLHIDGVVKGNVIADEESADSVLTLSERGTIEGDVRVPQVVVNGNIVGDVHARTHVELAAKARVNGNVYYTLIEMAMGSEVNGNLVHTNDADKSVVSIKRDEAATES